jgi:hypothetical protein
LNGKNFQEDNSMRKTFLPLLILFPFLISSCSPATPAATPEVVTVYSTSAAEPWLHELYDCAGTAPVLSRVDDPSAAQISLRVGEPRVVKFAYQIDTEDILIVTQRQSPVNHLTLDGARALFSGQGDPSVQVWVYAPGEDVQQVFDQFVMEGRIVAPSASIAANPQQMSDTLVNMSNTVGILPRHWKVGDAREVFSAATVPVLAIPSNEPQGTIKTLIACLQK